MGILLESLIGQLGSENYIKKEETFWNNFIGDEETLAFVYILNDIKWNHRSLGGN